MYKIVKIIYKGVLELINFNIFLNNQTNLYKLFLQNKKRLLKLNNLSLINNNKYNNILINN